MHLRRFDFRALTKYVDINIICQAQAKGHPLSRKADRSKARVSRAGEGDELTPEFSHYVRDNCLCLHVQRAARALARRFDDELRVVGLSSGQFSLMISLNRVEAPTIGSVSALLAMDRTSLTSNLKPLQRLRLVTVTVDPDDRRTRRLALTPAGRTLLAKAAPLWKQAHADIEHLIIGSAADLRATLRTLHQE
jgi:DNA-binding MarR family transcriptional regulator